MMNKHQTSAETRNVGPVSAPLIEKEGSGEVPLRSKDPPQSPLGKGRGKSADLSRNGSRSNRTRAPRATGIGAYGLIAFLAVLPACQAPLRNESKIAAMRRWSNVRADIKLQMARQSLADARFEEAANSAQEASLLNPDAPDAYAVIARCRIAMGNDAAARQALEQAEQLAIATAEMSYLWGVLMERDGQHEEALGRFASARSREPTSTQYLLAHAHCLVNLDRSELALRLLNDHARRADDVAAVAAMTASIAELLGQDELAIRRYRMAVADGERNPLVLEQFARLLIQGRHHEEAVSILEPLVANGQDPHTGLDRYAGPDSYAGLDSHARLDSHAGLNPHTEGSVRRLLATSYLALRRPRQAEKVIKPYAEASPTDDRAQMLLVQAALAMGDPLGALGTLERARRNGVYHPALTRLLGLAQLQSGFVAAASETLQLSIDAHPRDVEAHCLLAEVAVARNDSQSATIHFRRAHELDPSYAWANEGLRALGAAREESAVTLRSDDETHPDAPAAPATTVRAN